MLFNSYDFMIFFPVVVFIYFIIPKKTRYIWLLLASYYFYMSWNPSYALLIAISTFVTYLSGICLERVQNEQSEVLRAKKAKFILALSFIINLSILFFFKYFDFFWENLNELFTLFGLFPKKKPFDLLLPVGISFYTFQALGYTVDVYRKKLMPEKNLLRYALYVSFFPQLVAGPIERAKSLITQVDNVENIHLLNYERITGGFILMIWGYFLKMVIADRCAILVDLVYGEYWMYGSLELLLAALFFSLQIYCDFAGYSIIALGSARLMGFNLMENFDAPYFSKSIREFWRRWHISLSSWFRDYLYIPLGGSHVSKIRKYFNILLTFVVSGLWHGASWHYCFWGLLHGLYQIGEDVISPIISRLNKKIKTKTESFSYKLGETLVTFLLINLAFIFFRADSLHDAFSFLWRLFTHWDFWALSDGSLLKLGLNARELCILLFAFLIMFLVDLVKYKKKQTLDIFLSSQTLWFSWAFVLGLIFYIFIFGIYGPGYDASQFIYFQF